MSNIHCKWIEDDEQMLVGPDGQILPCCYLSGYFRSSIVPLKPRKESWEDFDEVKDQLYHIDLVNNLTHNEYLYKEYEKRKDKLNLFTNDLEDILSNEWFTEILPESWKDPNKIAAPCKKICTKYDK
jgi:hypothetical protein